MLAGDLSQQLGFLERLLCGVLDRWQAWHYEAHNRLDSCEIWRLRRLMVSDMNIQMILEPHHETIALLRRVSLGSRPRWSSFWLSSGARLLAAGGDGPAPAGIMLAEAVSLRKF